MRLLPLRLCVAAAILVCLAQGNAYAVADCFVPSASGSSIPGVDIDAVVFSQPEIDTEAWHGASIPITWNTCAHPTHLMTFTLIEGTHRTLIATGLANTGNFMWQVGSFSPTPAANTGGTPPSPWNSASWGNMGPNFKIEARMDPPPGSSGSHSHIGESKTFWIIPRPDIRVTEPAAGAVWKQGETHLVKWTVDDPYFGPTTKVELRRGGPDRDHPEITKDLGTVGQNTRELSWRVSDVLPNVDWYIHITPGNPISSNKPYPHQAFSAPFSIQVDTSNCFLTALWGVGGPSAYAHIVEFRRVKDRLRSLPGGGLLVRAYYAASPPFAKFVTKHAVVRRLLAGAMEPVAYTVSLVSRGWS